VQRLGASLAAERFRHAEKNAPTWRVRRTLHGTARFQTPGVAGRNEAICRTSKSSTRRGWGRVDANHIPNYMAYRREAYPVFFKTGVYPTHTLLVVDRLVEAPLLVEAHTVAAL